MNKDIILPQQNTKIKTAKIKKLRKKIPKWFEENQRFFPWREPNISSYQILIAEILLQKTRAENVVDIYLKFINKFANIKELSNANSKEIINIIRPLGFYNRKTRDLIKLSKEIMTKHGGKIPLKKSKLEELPGIGTYISNAFLCFACNKRVPIVDTNVKRIYSRYFGINVNADPRRDTDIWFLAKRVLPMKSVKEFNWGVLDFSALICKSRNPHHFDCPLRENCVNFDKS